MNASMNMSLNHCRLKTAATIKWKGEISHSMPETRGRGEADVAPCSDERGPLSLSTPKSASSVLEGYLNMNRAEGREGERVGHFAAK